MRDLLVIEIVVVVLLAASFTCVGLLAVWAATSPRHWFVRTLVFLAALSPLVLAPAYEPIVAFAIQGAVVAWGLQIRNPWRARREQKAPADAQVTTQLSGLRFSLSSLLLMMAIVAVVTPVAITLPALDLRTWTNVVVIGLTCGIITLVAAQMAASRRKVALWSIGICICLAAGFALFMFDSFIEAVVLQSGWPPPPPRMIPTGGVETPSAALWPCVLAATAAHRIDTVAMVHNAREPALARGIVTVMIVLIAALPLFVLWQLAHPSPMPQVQLPEPNGYKDFVAAGAQFNNSPILNTTAEPASTAQLAAEVKKYSPAFDRVRRGLARPCLAPVWPVGPGPPSSALVFPDIQSFRGVARALNLEAELAEREGRFRDAAKISVENIQFGDASARGGIIIHYLVGIAVKGIGHETLYRTIDQLDAQACQEAIEALERLDKNREPMETILHRDRIFTESEWGWYGHLLLVLDDLADTNREGDWAIRQSTSRSLTTNRLLRMELALRQYRLENGALPNRLEQLVPKYASSVPIDPYDASGRPLRYAGNTGGYLLYSVGYDGDDDAGRPSTQDSGWFDDGDMRLDYLLVDDDKTQTPTSDADDANTDEPAAPAKESSNQ